MPGGSRTTSRLTPQSYLHLPSHYVSAPHSPSHPSSVQPRAEHSRSIRVRHLPSCPRTGSHPHPRGAPVRALLHRV
ncbi:uncharacterized protein CC84DRAFT_1159076 [Paraphaeosphaeria sporulosa]|uniref:Uncharacterized protein n=1 Tax=Paraphaeosphaeria sporulosa TaxID=1460663 RepID=A0A177CXL8_9PLEO|nr:uncharacterized protein CC84DRAFT_1159076 [Paraphaeosphaeria sporulosa]OAG11577.1 hypothetical protein CC84DRAFT_1159076 [Paraphaeosphaeria sporulosa]